MIYNYRRRGEMSSRTSGSNPNNAAAGGHSWVLSVSFWVEVIPVSLSLICSAYRTLWKVTTVNRKLNYQWAMFNSYVRLPEGNSSTFEACNTHKQMDGVGQNQYPFPGGCWIVKSISLFCGDTHQQTRFLSGECFRFCEQIFDEYSRYQKMSSNHQKPKM